MADQNQISIEILSKMLKEMQKQSARYKDDDITNRVTRSRTDGSTITNRNIVNDFKRLGREVNHNIQAIQNSRKTFSDLKTSLKDMILPVSRMSKIYDEYKKSFKDYTRGQSDEFKKAANVTLDQFQKMAASGKSVSSSLSSLKDMQGYFNKSIENFSDGISNIDLEKDLDKRARELKSKRLDVMGQIREKKNSKKGTGTLDAELSKIEEELSQTNTQIAGLNKTNTDYINEYGKFVKEANSLHEQGIPILEGMNAADIDYATFMNKSNREQEEIVRKLGKNIGGIATGVVGFEAVLKDYKSAIDSSRKNLISSAKQAAMVLATVSATQLIKDYNATKKYNVESISPFQAGNMGMSQEELSTLIGQNKTFLRVAGNGNQNAMIDSGAFKELQNNAKQFGVYGKDAAELAAKFGNMQIQLGGSVDPTSIKNVMNDFKQLSDITDMTVDELMDYTDELNKNGTITALNLKYANKNEKEKQQAIREEISQRYKLNKYMGYSIEYLKKQQQLQTNSKFSSAMAGIQKMVAGNIAITEYEKNTGISLSKRDKQLALARYTNNEGGLNDDDRARAQSVVRQISSAKNVQMGQDQIDAVSKISAGGNYDPSKMIGGQILYNIQNQLNSENINAEELEGATQAERRSKLYQFDNLFGKGGTLDLANRNADDIGAATDAATAAANELGEAATTTKEKYEGFFKNPVGQASGALISLTKSTMELIAAQRVLSASTLLSTKGVGGAVGGIGGRLLASVGAASLSELASMSISALLATGASGVGVLVAAAITAAGAGVGIGMGINSIYDNSQAGKSFKALHDDENAIIYGFHRFANMISGNMLSPTLSDDNISQIEKIKTDRNQISILNSLMDNAEFGDNKDRLLARSLLKSKSGQMLLASNYDESSLQNLGASPELIEKIGKNSINTFMQNALASDGKNSDEITEILKMLNSNMEELKNHTVKTDEKKEISEKDKEYAKNRNFLQANDDRINTIRETFGVSKM